MFFSVSYKFAKLKVIMLKFAVVELCFMMDSKIPQMWATEEWQLTPLL